MYGVEPPVTVTDTAPLADPLQLTLVIESLAMMRAAGWVMVLVAVAVQLCWSVTVTVYVPAATPVKFCVVAPPVQL